MKLLNNSIILSGHTQNMKKNAIMYGVTGDQIDIYQQGNKGLFATYTHSYTMLAKQAKLLIDMIFVISDKPENIDWIIENELVYSVWPLMYVNNSDAFVNEDNKGIPVYGIKLRNIDKREGEADAQDVSYRFTVKLNTQEAVFYTQIAEPQKPVLGDTIPERIAGSFEFKLVGDTFQLDIPKLDRNTLMYPVDRLENTPQFNVVQFYSWTVVGQTLVDMSATLRANPTVGGVTGCLGAVIKAVSDRSEAGTSPGMPGERFKDLDSIYQSTRIKGDYNIAAALYTTNQRITDANINDLLRDVDKVVKFNMIGFAPNIKGTVKSGHAETRLLLSLDAASAWDGDKLWSDALDEAWEKYISGAGFYKAGDTFTFRNTMQELAVATKNNNTVLASSLKPCYLCAGELEASVEGLVRVSLSSANEPKYMWYDYPRVDPKCRVALTVYYDIDAAIRYAGSITVSIDAAREKCIQMLTLPPWVAWIKWYEQALREARDELVNPLPRPFRDVLASVKYKYILNPARDLEGRAAMERYANAGQMLLLTPYGYAKEVVWSLAARLIVPGPTVHAGGDQLIR